MSLLKRVACKMCEEQQRAQVRRGEEKLDY